MTGGNEISRDAIMAGYMYVFEGIKRGYLKNSGDFVKILCDNREKVGENGGIGKKVEKNGEYGKILCDNREKVGGNGGIGKKVEKNGEYGKILCDNREIDGGNGGIEKELVSKFKILGQALDNNINVVRSSSMGRFFDGISALLGICNYNSYEGECAEMLQNRAMKYLKDNGIDEIQFVKDILQNENFMSRIIYKEDDGEGLIVDTVRVFSDFLERVVNGEDRDKLAFEFHGIVAAFTIFICKKFDKKLALSGGTMYNSLLLRMIVPILEDAGYGVYINEQVPSGDGGLALGQIIA